MWDGKKHTHASSQNKNTINHGHPPEIQQRHPPSTWLDPIRLDPTTKLCCSLTHRQGWKTTCFACFRGTSKQIGLEHIKITVERMVVEGSCSVRNVQNLSCAEIESWLLVIQHLLSWRILQVPSPKKESNSSHLTD